MFNVLSMLQNKIVILSLQNKGACIFKISEKTLSFLLLLPSLKKKQACWLFGPIWASLFSQVQFVFTAPAIPPCIYELNQQYQWQNNSQMHVSLLYRHIWKQVAHYEMQTYRKCQRIDKHNAKPFFRNHLESNELKNFWLKMNQLKGAVMQDASTTSGLGRPPTHYFLFVSSASNVAQRSPPVPL